MSGPAGWLFIGPLKVHFKLPPWLFGDCSHGWACVQKCLKHACPSSSSMHARRVPVLYFALEPWNTSKCISNKAKNTKSWSTYFFFFPSTNAPWAVCRSKKEEFCSCCLIWPSVDPSLYPERWKMSVRVLHVSEMKKRQNKLNKEKDSYGRLQSVTPSALWRVFLQRKFTINTRFFARASDSSHTQ